MMKQKKTYTLRGTLKRHPDGFGFVIPDDKEHPDIYISSSQIGSALSHDKVEVSVYQKKQEGPRSYFGYIESISKRHKEFVVGYMKIKNNQNFITGHNLGFSQSLRLTNPKKMSVKEGDYIKARIHFKNSHKLELENLLTTEMIQNLGSLSSQATDDNKRIMSEYNLPFEFTTEELQQVELLPSQVREKDYEGRIDLRDKPFVTIDGATAQDFDDAICVEKHKQFYRLYVAIADVSYYVQEDSLLDQCALERSNSTYFPNSCIPMLPEKLSNNLCSLIQDKERLVMVQQIDFDPQGYSIKSSVYPSVIKSRKRLTYGQAQEILDNRDDKSAKPAYWDSLKLAKILSEILMQKHKTELGFDLDIPETVVVVNEQGETEDILKQSRLFTHKMIEQFMLAANKAVSAFLEKNKSPVIYRIHEKPNVQKLNILEKFAKSLSFSKDFQSRANLIQFLNQYKEHDKISLIHKLVLRSMAQAHYSIHNKGHYGLNFKSYTHFTSPIRRYCDLQIHRLIKKVLDNKTNLQQVSFQKKLEQQAQFISAKEQNSVKAERLLKDIKSVRFIKKHVGENFIGSVSSITNFGLFITLKDFFVEGLVRFQDIRGFWVPDEWGLYVSNKRTGYKIHFGDKVEVLIRAGNVHTGQIDLSLMSHTKKPRTS